MVAEHRPAIRDRAAHDDVDRALAAFGLAPITYFSFPNVVRRFEVAPATPGTTPAASPPVARETVPPAVEPIVASEIQPAAVPLALALSMEAEDVRGSDPVEPEAAEPVAPEPAHSEPVAEEAMVAEPVVVEPVVVEPVVVEPVVVEATVADPVVAIPIAESLSPSEVEPEIHAVEVALEPEPTSQPPVAEFARPEPVPTFTPPPFSPPLLPAPADQMAAFGLSRFADSDPPAPEAVDVETDPPPFAPIVEAPAPYAVPIATPVAASPSPPRDVDDMMAFRLSRLAAPGLPMPAPRPIPQPPQPRSAVSIRPPAPDEAAAERMARLGPLAMSLGAPRPEPAPPALVQSSFVASAPPTGGSAIGDMFRLVAGPREEDRPREIVPVSRFSLGHHHPGPPTPAKSPPPAAPPALPAHAPGPSPEAPSDGAFRRL